DVPLHQADGGEHGERHALPGSAVPSAVRWCGGRCEVHGRQGGGDEHRGGQVEGQLRESLPDDDRAVGERPHHGSSLTEPFSTSPASWIDDDQPTAPWSSGYPVSLALCMIDHLDTSSDQPV